MIKKTYYYYKYLFWLKENFYVVLLCVSIKSTMFQYNIYNFYLYTYNAGCGITDSNALVGTNFFSNILTKRLTS